MSGFKLQHSAEPPFLIGIDVGTQSIRTLAFDTRGHKRAEARRATPMQNFAGGLSEYDPEALFATVTACLSETATQLAGRPVAGIAVASIGESCVVIDDQGRPLAPSIAWFDRRGDEAARALSSRIGADRVFEITGLKIEPIFTLCKLAWMKDHWSEAFGRVRRVLQIADWIAFRLSGVAATDFTLASRTLYLDLARRRWSDELLGHVGLDGSVLAPLVRSGLPLARVRPEILDATGLAGQPIVAAGAHDHVCGSFVAGLSEPGALVDSIGTAEALLLATAHPLLDPAAPRLGFFQGAVGTHRSLFYIGGSMATSGGAIEWLRRLTGNPSNEAIIAEARAAETESRSVIFLPNLVDSAPPHPDFCPLGAFLGLTARTSRGALYRAVLEGLATQADLILCGMAALPTLTSPTKIHIIGGGSRNGLFMEIKAAVYGRPITVVDEPEATALGAALLAGVGAGLWPDLDAAVAALDQHQHVVEPEPALIQQYRGLRERIFEESEVILNPLNQKLAALAPTAGKSGVGESSLERPSSRR